VGGPWRAPRPIATGQVTPIQPERRPLMPRRERRCLVESSWFVLMIHLIADQLRSALRPSRCPRAIRVAVGASPSDDARGAVSPCRAGGPGAGKTTTASGTSSWTSSCQPMTRRVIRCWIGSTRRTGIGYWPWDGSSYGQRPGWADANDLVAPRLGLPEQPVVELPDHDEPERGLHSEPGYDEFRAFGGCSDELGFPAGSVLATPDRG
jgi:hypothetical protein